MTINETTFARPTAVPALAHRMAETITCSPAQTLAQMLADAAIGAISLVGDWTTFAVACRRARAQARRDRAALLSMPDHMLRDIGLSRQEIAFAYGKEQSLRGRES